MMEVEFQHVEKTQRKEELIPCHLWFDEHEDPVIIDLMVTYQRGEYWSEITDVEVDCPESMIMEYASSFKEDVEFSIEWSTRKTIIGPIQFRD